MKRKNIIEISIHIIFWLITLYFFVNNSYLRMRSLNEMEEYLTFFFVPLIVYINQFFLIPKFFIRQRFILYFSILAALLISMSYFEFLIIKDDIIKCLTSPDIELFYSCFRWSFFGILIRDTVFIGIFTMIKIYRDAIKTNTLQKANNELEKKQLQHQINFIKSKINNHFFFNALSSIYYLALENSAKTADVVLNLTDLMEYVVKETDKQWVSLENEIDFLKNYIALEGARYKDMNVKFDINGDTRNHKLPPMIFETFVNNAFKFTNFKQKGKIYIEINCSKNEILFVCKNDIDQSSERIVKSTGNGLTNVRNRLNLIYKDNYKLEVNEMDNYHETKLFLKQ